MKDLLSQGTTPFIITSTQLNKAPEEGISRITPAIEESLSHSAPTTFRYQNIYPFVSQIAFLLLLLVPIFEGLPIYSPPPSNLLILRRNLSRSTNLV